MKIAPEVKSLLKNQKWTLNHLYRIIDKKGHDVPFKLNWAQEEMLDCMHKRNIILKCRQIGSTTFWCIYLLNKALFNPNPRIGIISYSLHSAHDIFNKILKHAYRTMSPHLLKLPQVQLVQDTAREMSFANGSSIRVDTSMRGGTLTSLLITEFGKVCARFPAKAKEIITGSLNTLSLDSECIIESTAEGPFGEFAEMWEKSWENRDKEKLGPLEWKPFFYPWFEESKYTLEREDLDVA